MASAFDTNGYGEYELKIETQKTKRIKIYRNFIHSTALIVFLVLVAWMALMPRYTVWARGMKGKAELAQAEQNRQIAVSEAEAAKSSEILRAQGVSEANKIIADSLKGRTEYLTYLWIQGLNDGNSEVIYIPTESNLPLLEAGRISK